MSPVIKNKISALEAAQLIGVSRNTILVWAKKGKLTHTKILSHYFFDPDDVLDLIETHKPHNVQIDLLA